MIVISSCSTQKQMTSTTTTTTKESSSVSILDSLFQRASIAENVDISWNFDEDPNENPGENPIKPSCKGPPRKGSIHVKISKQAEQVKQQSKVEKKEKLKQKQKTKNKKSNKLIVKKGKNNLWVNAFLIIIFGLIVNFLFQHKNILKKVWN